MTVGQLKTLIASMPDNTRLTIWQEDWLGEDVIENDNWKWFPAGNELRLDMRPADEL